MHTPPTALEKQQRQLVKAQVVKAMSNIETQKLDRRLEAMARRKLNETHKNTTRSHDALPIHSQIRPFQGRSQKPTLSGKKPPGIPPCLSEKETFPTPGTSECQGALPPWCAAPGARPIRPAQPAKPRGSGRCCTESCGRSPARASVGLVANP